MHNESSAVGDRRKIAKNTTSGIAHAGKTKMNGELGFDKGSDAINHTPYARYQDAIQKRNLMVEKKNLSHLKQD